MDRSGRRVSLPGIIGVATMFGIFSGLQAYNYVSLFMEQRTPFHVLLALNLTYWYAWAALVPGILWLARRYRFGRHTWRRAASMHGLGVLGATFIHAVLSVTARVVIMRTLAGRDVAWWPAFHELFFLNFDWEMMTYWAVVGLSHALEFHRESQERALTAAHLQTKLAEAQLQALQRQLHPHFLFNTLHTISALMHRDTMTADAMLARLSDLLRLTLDRIGVQHVPLHEELDFIEKYLDIERTRYGDRLQVQFDVQPETLDASVPNLLLQPLVENAVRHGIAPKIGGGRVEIGARAEGGELHLVVRDNGFGPPGNGVASVGTGVGLTNTRSRLEHLYGSHHRLEFDRPAAGGLAVTIVIPLVRERQSPGGSPMESVA
jgi:two-component system, LytTR family, sensor kinase